MTEFTLFAKLDKNSLNEKFAALASDASNAFGNLISARSKLTDDVKVAVDELYETAKNKHKAVETATDKVAAQAEALEAKESLKSFLRGDKAHKVGEKTIELKGDVGKELREAFVEAEQASQKVTKPAQGFFAGTVRTQKDGFTKALKQNGEKMKFWKEGMTVGERGKAFAHGGAAVGAVVGMGDAILRSKNSEGEDRSALMRMAEFVVAGGVGALALVGGPAMAR